MPEFDHLAVHDYHANAYKRVKYIHYQITRKSNGRKPDWMSEKVHADMMKHVDDDEFKKRSEQAKKNRRGGSLTNNVEPSHFQGSISTTEAAKKMVSLIM